MKEFATCITHLVNACTDHKQEFLFNQLLKQTTELTKVSGILKGNLEPHTMTLQLWLKRSMDNIPKYDQVSD